MIITKSDNYIKEFTQFIKKSGTAKLAMGLATLISMVALIRLAKLSPLSRFQLLDMTLDFKNKVFQYIKSGFKTPSQKDSATPLKPDYDYVIRNKLETALQKMDVPSDTSTNIDHLPAEVLDTILLYVDQPTKTVLVCRRWRHVTNNLPRDPIKGALTPERWEAVFTPEATTLEIYRRATSYLVKEARGLKVFSESFWLASCPKTVSEKALTVSANCCKRLQKAIVRQNLNLFINNWQAQSLSERERLEFIDILKPFSEERDTEVKGFKKDSCVSICELLYISGTAVTELPREIQYFQSLKFLDLTNNKLKIIPPQIAELKNLEALWLNKNQLEFIPESIFRLRLLTDLQLSYNKIKTLSPQISKLQKLGMLLLNNNELESIPREVCFLQNLRCLRVSYNPNLVLSPEILELQAYRDAVEFEKVIEAYSLK